MNFFSGIPLMWKLIGAGVLIFAVHMAIHLYTRQSEKVGELTQSNKDLTHTIKEVDDAHKAQDQIRRDPGALYNQCVRDSRTPQNCK